MAGWNFRPAFARARIVRGGRNAIYFQLIVVLETTAERKYDLPFILSDNTRKMFP
jgi:hypothetical protein